MTQGFFVNMDNLLLEMQLIAISSELVTSCE